MSEHLPRAYEKSRFVSDAWISTFAQITGVVGSLLLLPVLTRNLGPERYGLWVLVLALVSYTLPWSDIGLSNALMRFVPGYRSDGTRHAAFRLARRTSAGISLCIGTGLALGAESIAQHLFGGVEHARIVRPLGVLVFLEAQFFILTTFLQAREKISIYALLNASRSIADLAFLALFALQTADLVHLVYAKIAVLLALIVWQWSYLRPLRWNSDGTSFSSWSELRRFIGYGFPLIFNNIVWLFIMLVDRNMLEHYRSVAVVGIYSLADSIALCLLNFSRPLSTVILPKFSNLLSRQSDEINLYLEKGIKFSYLVLFPALVGIILTGDLLVALLGSSDFSHAIRPLPFLCISYFLFSLFYPVYHLTVIKRGGKTILLLSLISLLINVILNVLLIPSMGAIGAGISTCCCFLFFVTGLSCSCRVGLRSSLWKLAPELGRITAAGVGMGSLVWGVRHFLPIWDLAVFPLGIISYALLVLYTGGVSRQERRLLFRPLLGVFERAR